MNPKFLQEFSNANRHNIVVLQCRPDDLSKLISETEQLGVPVLNIGRVVAEKARELSSAKFLTIELQEFLDRTLQLQAVLMEEDQPEVVAVYNLGILLEPQLGLNGPAILKDASKNTAIVVLWENQIDPPALLHWGIAQDKYAFDFSDISQLRVYSYEI